MSRALPLQSLLDIGKVPVADLARIAVREGVRPRAVYQAHKWFARRLSITARALLVAAAAEPSDRFWSCFYRGDGWTGRSVLDPFVGGGVMLLEAARLGADVHGVDIEPVAAAISRFQTQLGAVPDLDAALERLAAKAGRAVEPYYEARDARGRKETLLHAFWVQQVRCRSCRNTIDAHPTFRFAWDDERQRQWVACRSCSRVIEASATRERVVCSCGVSTKASAGHLERGDVCCPKCGTREALIEGARRTKAPPEFRIFAVETLSEPEGDARRHGIPKRRIRTASAFDLDRYAAAARQFKKVLGEHPRALPTCRIPRRGRKDMRLVSYGYGDYRELFNARQQLHLALLGREILRLKGSLREAMAIAFSDHLTTNNMMCGYAGGWRRLTPLFSIRAYRHIARPVEINPWLRHNGRGTFPNAVRAVIRAAHAFRNPVEPTPLGVLKPIKDAPPGRSVVCCGDARRLQQIRSGSIDLVLTDPPYFDYISYSELGHFFAPWFARFGLITADQARGFPAGQLASSARSRNAENAFARRLATAFREIRRVCRPNGRIVFTYQNLDGRGWQAIGSALASAGIIPINTFPLYGDSSASLHKHAHSISWDCVMVCRRGKPIRDFTLSAAALADAAKVAARWSEKLAAKELQLTDGDRMNIAHAAAIVAEFAARLSATKKAANSSVLFRPDVRIR